MSVLLTPADNSQLLSVTQKDFWKLVRAGRFPPPDLRLSAKRAYWKRETVEGWINGGTRQDVTTPEAPTTPTEPADTQPDPTASAPSGRRCRLNRRTGQTVA